MSFFPAGAVIEGAGEFALLQHGKLELSRKLSLFSDRANLEEDLRVKAEIIDLSLWTKVPWHLQKKNKLKLQGYKNIVEIAPYRSTVGSKTVPNAGIKRETSPPPTPTQGSLPKRTSMPMRDSTRGSMPIQASSQL